MTKSIKVLKIGAFCLATAITLMLIILANVLLGNPVSRVLAYNTGKKYIAQSLTGTDYRIDAVKYNWKVGGGYSVMLETDEQIDGDFYLSTDMLGRITYDYSYLVTDKINTSYRVESEYDNAVNYVVSHIELPFEPYNVWGRLLFREEIPVDGYPNGIAEDISISSLEVNKLYNVQDFGEKIGAVKIFLRTDCNDITYDNAAEFLLKFREACDDFGVKFYSIGFAGNISFEGLLYEDIYEDGLVERIKEAEKSLDDYYMTMDKK